MGTVTAAEAQPQSKVSFGLFEADLAAGELRKSGIRVRIQGQPFKVLTILLERPNEVVTREELQQRLWGTQTTVDFDHSLGTAINKLREALGDSAENPIFVETLARKGYRFIAPIRVERPTLAIVSASTEIAPDAPTMVAIADPVSELTPGKVQHRFHIPSLLLAAVVSAIVTALVILAFHSPATPVRISQLTYSGRVLSSMTDLESLSSTATDGSRIYFSQISNGTPILTQALIANGEVSTLSLPSGIQAPMIGSISPDRSKLVVRNHLDPDTEQSIWIVPTLGGNARRVADVLAHDATWMPDGQHILFAFNHDLYVVKEDGSDRRKFATLSGRAFWLRWSPKGDSLRFTILNTADRSASLWELSASGRGLHPLLNGWTKPASECCGNWSADGRHYFFQSSHSGSPNIWEMDEKTWWRPWSSRLRMVTNGPLDFGGPTTSVDGHRIYFIGANSRWEMRMFSPQGEFVPLQSGLASTSLVEYSPDGKWVAWLSSADGSLWRSRIDGTERVQLLSLPFHVFMMRWSPKDDRLAVMAQQSGGPWKLYLVDAAGGGMQPVLDEKRNEADPDWSADANSLIFGRVPDVMGGDNLPKAIYMVDLHSHKASQIPGSAGLFSPRLSPDGRFIAAVRADRKALMLFDVSKQAWSEIAQHSIADPVWTHDSRAVLFQDFAEPGKPIYRANLSGDTAPHRIATLENVRSTDVLDYRLVGLTRLDAPLVSAQTSVVDLYSINLDDR